MACLSAISSERTIRNHPSAAISPLESRGVGHLIHQQDIHYALVNLQVYQLCAICHSTIILKKQTSYVRLFAYSSRMHEASI